MVGLLGDQGRNGVLDGLCHGVHLVLLGDVLPPHHRADGGLHGGEVLIVLFL